MNGEERVIAKALSYSVIAVWLGVYLDSVLFCIFGGVFLGIALTAWTAINATRAKT